MLKELESQKYMHLGDNTLDMRKKSEESTAPRYLYVVTLSIQTEKSECIIVSRKRQPTTFSNPPLALQINDVH